MSNRNRTAGHNWEREVRNDFRTIGYKEAETSRYASRKMDDQKVDLVDTGIYNIQCKVSNKALDFCKILGEMPDDDKVNVVLAKMTDKKGKRFMTKKRLAVLDYYHFITLLLKIKRLQEKINESIN